MRDRSMKWRDKKFKSLRRSKNQKDRNHINVRVKIERVTKKKLLAIK